MVKGNDGRRGLSAIQKATALAWLLIIALVAVFVLPAVFRGNKSGDTTPKPTYTASVGRFSVEDPATVVVVVRIKNTGTVAGAPRCLVHASNKSGSYKGSSSLGANRALAPNEESDFDARLTISKEGARYITEGYADCN